MLFLGRKKQAKKLNDAEQDGTRRVILHTRLNSTLDSVLLCLKGQHDLSPSLIDTLTFKANSVRDGMELVLINGISAFDDSIPSHLRGGAIIANSADAFSSMAATIGKPDLEIVVGSPDDGETTGHMCHQLGFSRDGSALIFS